MSYLNHNDSALRAALQSARVIAVVGHSDRPERTSYQIAQYLRTVGYTVYAVNPAVTTIDGERSYARLADIPEAIDIVNVFRRSEYLPEVVQDAIHVGAKTIWAQLGVHDAASVEAANNADLDIVTDLCIKVEHMRLGVPSHAE